MTGRAAAAGLASSGITGPEAHAEPAAAPGPGAMPWRHARAFVMRTRHQFIYLVVQGILFILAVLVGEVLLMNGKLTWRKSMISSAMDGCVEVAVRNDRIIALRDSKHGGGPILEIPSPAWAIFLADIKRGKFDLSISDPLPATLRE